MQVPIPQAIPVHPASTVQRPKDPPNIRRTVKRRRTALRSDQVGMAPVADVAKDNDRDPTRDPLAYQVPSVSATRSNLGDQTTLLDIVSKLSKFFESQGGEANRLLSEMVTVGNTFGHYTELAVLKQNAASEVQSQIKSQEATGIIMTIIGDLVGIIFAVSIGALIGGPAGAIMGLAVGVANLALSFPYKKGFTVYGAIANGLCSAIGVHGKARFWTSFALKLAFSTAVGLAAGGVTGVYYAGLGAAEAGANAVEDAAEEGAEDGADAAEGFLSKVNNIRKTLGLGLRTIGREMSWSYVGDQLNPLPGIKALGSKIASLPGKLVGIFTDAAGDAAEEDAADASATATAEDGAPGTSVLRKTNALRRALYVALDNFNTVANSFTSDDTGTPIMKDGKRVGTKYSDSGGDNLWSDIGQGMGESSTVSGLLTAIPEGIIDIALMAGSLGGTQFFGEMMQSGDLGFLAKVMPYLQYLGLTGNLGIAGAGAYESGVQIHLLKELGQDAARVAQYQKKATDVSAVNQALHTMLTRMSDRNNDLMGTIRTILDGIPEIFRDMQV